MFGGIADDRHHDHADEDLGEPEAFGCGPNGADQKLASGRDEVRRHCEHDQGLGQCSALGAMVLAALPHIVMPVRSERKEQAQDLGREQHARDDQAQFLFDRAGTAADRIMKEGRHDETDRGEQQ